MANGYTEVEGAEVDDRCARGADAVEAGAVEERGESRGELLQASTGAGLLAGAAMLAWVAGAAAIWDLPLLHPLRLTGGTFIREAAEGGPVVVLLGALVWASISVTLGTVYAACIPREISFACASTAGVGYAALIMAVASSVLESVNPDMREAMAEIGGAWVLGYAVFGATLGLVPVLRRRVLAA